MNPNLRFSALICAYLCRANIVLAVEPLAFPVLSVDMGSGCAISVIDYYRGHLKSGMPANASYWTDTPPVRSSLGEFGINFECQANQNIADLARQYGAQWDARKGAWQPYYEDLGEQRLAEPASHIYQLESQNSSGFLRTTDQINGEEDQRVRFYSFCLFHANEAVCGDGQSMRLVESKGNYLPHILRVLRSVKFIDTSAGTSSP